MRQFTLIRPEDLAGASAAGSKDDTVLKAAGIDLLDRLKERVENPGKVVDLQRLDDLRGIANQEVGVRIGALSTLSEIAESGLFAGAPFGALRHAATVAATPQIRNRATIAGNLVQETRCWYYRSAAFKCLHDLRGDQCLAIAGENRYHAVLGTLDCMRVHPSNLAPPLFVLGAIVRTWLEGKARSLPMAELYPRAPGARAPEHNLQRGEIITAIDVPKQPAGARSAYVESREKQSFDWPTTAAAVRLVVEGGAVAAASICLGAVAPVPLPARPAAAWLEGKEAIEANFRKASALAYDAAIPLEHNRYKIRVGQAVLVDALLQAAGGNG